MVLSRRWAGFLILVGVWTWAIWPRFGLAIWNDTRAWSTGQIGQGSPTGFLWVHALLIGASLAIGTAVGALGVRAWWAARRAGRPDGATLDETGRPGR
ncbi:SCO4848 family membrane protein [Plantactinospora sonchi]|uniref:Integral membrane protein n=1 Tax=Plantactinospora sonchi TaxID=1544735 RepID=A0ABU7S4S4_9ACTN